MTESACPACGRRNDEHRPTCRIGTLEREQNAAVGVLWAACDRDWKDENLYQTAVIAANAIYWRDRKILELETKLAFSPWAACCSESDNCRRKNADVRGCCSLG